MSIPEAEQRKLFLRSGNRCAFPDCRRLLSAEGSPPDRLVVLGELAHIVAERPQGPRGNSPLPLSERNRAENLILLCNNHHQLIDSQPQTYTVQRLQAMKEAHEGWVEKTLGTGRGDDSHALQPSYISEVVHSTLLPVERMPVHVYAAPCDQEEQAIQSQLGSLRKGEMAPYIVRGKMLFAFQNLAEHGNPFEPIVDRNAVECFQVTDWWSDADRLAWFVQLTNRALNKLTGRRGLYLDREHNRYYFPPAQPGLERAVRYKPLNQRRASRQVVWQPKKKASGEARPFWYHRAVALRFLRIAECSWILCIRPELRVTTDGVNPLPSETIGGRVTRKKSRMFNYDLLAEVQFWRDYLSDSQPRILLPFGDPRQVIVIPTTLIQGKVLWPGIPEEHAKPFKNVEYLDDLFSWAQFQALAGGVEEDEDDWLEDEIEGDGDD